YEAAREDRRAKLNSSYKYIFEVLSAGVGLDLPTVEELMLDIPSFEAIDSFLAKGGKKSLKIFYQEGDARGVECGRVIPGAAKGSRISQFYVEKTPGKITGLCLYFVRYKNDTSVNDKTIHEDISFGVLDATDGLIPGIKDIIEKVFLPAVLATSNWGTLDESKEDTKEKQKFVETINRYISFLGGAAASIEGTVQLKKIDDINFSELQTFDKITAAADNYDTVHHLEEVLMIWYRQIEHVLIESKQIRREAKDSGPLTELQNWKYMSAKLNFIIEQIKGEDCKAVISVLKVAHSKILKSWQQLDSKITDAANESKDNVKYLGTLERICRPLYTTDVVSMAQGIPNLIKAVQMIHRISKYYNTSERITSLLIKVTNQMVTTCKAYITDAGLNGVWEQDTPIVIGKINECIYLLKEYQKCFREAKQEILESLGEKSFEVSEMYIFGKSEAFCRRLEKIMAMIAIEQNFNALTLCAIEGIDLMAVKFKNVYHIFQKKPYDTLDPQVTEFDTDFVKFMTEVERLEAQLQTFMRNCFRKIVSSQNSLRLLQRFQNLNMPCLQEEIAHTVGCILQHYVADLETTKKLYQAQKDDPPLARNMPPIAGKILWVRQLFRRVNEPISYFHKHSNILESPEGKAVVQSYNKLAYVLVEFEVVYHSAWLKEMSQLQYPLQSTIFVRHPKTERLLVNFDPQIVEIVRETKCMIKLGLEVPEQAFKIAIMESQLKSNKSQLEVLVESYEDLRKRTPNVFVNLLTPKRSKMEAVLRQGLTMLTWSSVTLETFFQDAGQALYIFSQLLRKVNILGEVQIGTLLREISSTSLVSLPVDGPIEIKDLLTDNEVYTKECAESLNIKSMHIEDAVQELIYTFERHYDLPSKTSQPQGIKGKHIAFEGKEKEKGKTPAEGPHSDDSKGSDKEEEFKKHCKDLHAYFSRRLLISLQKATRLSLDRIRRRMSVSKLFFSKSKDITPFLKAEVHLEIPNLVIVPSLDEIQQAINRMIHLTLEVNRGIAQWGQRHLQKSILKTEPGMQQASAGFGTQGKRSRKGERTDDTVVRKLKNFYSGVAENETITKIIVLLSSAAISLKEGASEALQEFDKYKELWTEDKDTKFQELFATDPTLSEIREEILHYDAFEQETKNLKPIIPLGPIELHTGPLRRALTMEANSWKMVLCRYLNEEYKKKLLDILSFINGHIQKLSRPLSDLDDVRLAMEALCTIQERRLEIDMTMGPIE
ncbi:DYH8 protein, partial [Pachycephala philippinensis]|nr:DYH8 protein [Pachycephala philippinensis]